MVTGWVAPPTGSDFVLEVGVGGVDLLDRIPDPVSDDGGWDSALDVDLFAR